jgi:hypothetical protein
MVAPLTPKPTRKAEALTKETPTIVSRREEDAALKKYRKESINQHPLQFSRPPLSTPNGNAKLIFFTFNTPPPIQFFFFPSRARFWEGKKRREGREKEMEGTGDGSVEPSSGVHRKRLLFYYESMKRKLI